MGKKGFRSRKSTLLYYWQSDTCVGPTFHHRGSQDARWKKPRRTVVGVGSYGGGSFLPSRGLFFRASTGCLPFPSFRILWWRCTAASTVIKKVKN